MHTLRQTHMSCHGLFSQEYGNMYARMYLCIHVNMPSHVCIYVHVHEMRLCMLQGVKETPDDFYVWQFLGTLTIQGEGKYTICTKSDDGCEQMIFFCI